jgi:hypothetical protein
MPKPEKYEVDDPEEHGVIDPPGSTYTAILRTTTPTFSTHRSRSTPR